MNTQIEPGDMEDELRELFRDKAGEAPLGVPGTPAGAPTQVLRRGRRRQVFTVVGAAGVVALLAVGSIAGVQGLLGRGPEPVPTGDYAVFQRTVTVEAFTVSSPSNWYLVNEWPLSLQIPVEVTSSASEGVECQEATPGGGVQECSDAPGAATSEGSASPIPVPYGLPMIQLTNVDLGLETNACRDGVPNGGAVLYVASDYPAYEVDTGIPPFPPGQGLPPEGDGPCGHGRYAYFEVNNNLFFAWIGLGSDVTAEDREIVETAYEQMSAIPDWTPQPSDQSTPGYVIAGFSDDGLPWRLEARPGQDVTISRVIPGATGDFEFALDGQPVTWCCSPISYPGTIGDVVFGTIQLDASGVEYQPVNGTAVQGTILPLPPSLGSGFDLFFIEGVVGDGDVVAVGLGSGEPIGPSPSAPPTAGARGDEVELSGEYQGVPWVVRATGSFAEGDACLEATIASETQGPLCHEEDPNPLTAAEPSADSWTTTDLNLFVTSVDPAVVELRFRSDDGSNVPSDFQCAMGPTGWTDPDRRVCVLPLPPQGSGTLEFLDASGRVLFANGMGWGASEVGPAVSNVSPTHGGEYWAVYAWAGAPGDPEADQVSARLAEEFGIEAFQGELGCDQGAAEALGMTDADHGIGVYFETREDAEAFAAQLVDAGVTNDAPIARVTTFCLE